MCRVKYPAGQLHDVRFLVTLQASGNFASTPGNTIQIKRHLLSFNIVAADNVSRNMSE
jgi:hypothetical protein